MASTGAGHSKHFTNLISGVIAALTLVFGLPYILVLVLMYRNAQRHPRDFKTDYGEQLQRYCPVFYAFLVFSGLAEIALASWLLLEYRYNNNFPNSTAERGVKLVLFSACWTTVTAGLYTCLFLHLTWYRHSIASIGAQAAWLLATWTFWVAGASLLNNAIPSLFMGGTCVTVVYCGQLQTLFAFSVLQIFTLSIGMLTIVLLAWQSMRDVPPKPPPK